MSNQPRKVREHLARLKASGIITPEQRDPRQFWLLVMMEPMEGRQGEFFVTHAKNFDKFSKRKGFTIIGHGFDRGALTLAARSATENSGPAFQPPNSAWRTPLNRPKVEEPDYEKLLSEPEPEIDFIDEVDPNSNQED